MADFVGKGRPNPSSLRIHQYVHDTYVLRQESVVGDFAVARFPHKMEVRHWATITRDMHYAFQLLTAFIVLTAFTISESLFRGACGTNHRHSSYR